MAMVDSSPRATSRSLTSTRSPTNIAAARKPAELTYSERLTMPEAIDAVGEMLNAFPNARDGVRGGWVGIMARLLLDYPKSIALRCCDPVNGVVRECKFLPTVSEAIKWLEREVQPLQKAAQWDKQSRAQLAERERLDQDEKAEPLERRKAVVARINAELAAKGFPPIAGLTTPNDLAVAAHKEKLLALGKITQEQFDALPDLPKGPDYWRGVRWP